MSLLHLFWIVPAAMYMCIGLYLGIRWGIEERDAIIPLVAMVIWPFIAEPEDAKFLRRMPKAQRELAGEKKRMDRELAIETAQVELLEVTRTHRLKMDEVHERRRKILDDESERVING